jgi:hypothetical protein
MEDTANRWRIRGGYNGHGEPRSGKVRGASEAEVGAEKWAGTGVCCGMRV